MSHYLSPQVSSSPPSIFNVKSLCRRKAVLIIVIVLFLLSSIFLLRIFRKITPSSNRISEQLFESEESVWKTKRVDETILSEQQDNNQPLDSTTISQWLPIRIDECKSGMYKFSAPCLQQNQNSNSNLVKGIELIYHAFKIKSPIFYNLIQKKIWLEQSKEISIMKWNRDYEWAIYPSINGQILMFNSVYIDPILNSDVWNENNCIGQSSSHSKYFKTEPSEKETYENVDSLLISTTPDSFSFQHFLDRVTVVWGQASLEFDSKQLSILAGKEPKNPIVNEIYQIISQKHYHRRAIYAKEVIFSCRSPLVHPFTTQRITNEILNHLDMEFKIPFKDRKKIVYLTRSNGGSENGGRMILNEDDVLEHLKLELLTRNMGEELVIFDSRDLNNLREIVNYFDNVRAIFGPHGASFYNSRFAPRQLAILEVLPGPNFFYQGFWQQASLLEQTYGVYYAQWVDYDNNMVIKNIPQFVKYFLNIIDETELRKPQDVLQKHYYWQFFRESS